MERSEIHALSVRELRHELSQLNLSTAGNKAALRERLCDHFQIDHEVTSENDTTIYEDARSSYKSKFTLKDIQESISYFDGNGHPDIDDWVEEFEDNARIVGWDDIQKFIYAKQLIKGAARIFIRSQPTMSNWQELKNVLVSEFGQKFTAIDIHKQMQKRRKRYQETYLEYLYTLMEIASKIKLDEKSIIDYFIDGIYDSRQNKFILYDASSIAELKQKIKAYEKMKTGHYKYDNSKFYGQENANKNPNYSQDTKNNYKNNNNYKKTYTENNKICNNCPHLRNHITEDCFKNTCFRCKQKGHKSFECKERDNRVHIRQNRNENENKKPRENNTNILVLPHEDFSKFELKINSTANLKIPVRVHGVDFTALFDTGSDISVITKSVLKKLKNIIIFPYKIKLNGVGQGHMTTNGYILVTAEIKNIKVNTIFHIIEDQDIAHEAIVGSDILEFVNVHVTTSGPDFVLKEKQRSIEDMLHELTLGSRLDTIDSNFVAGKVFNSICNDSSIDEASPLDLDHLNKVNKHVIKEMVLNYEPNKVKSPEVEMKIVVKDDLPIYHRPRRFPLSEQNIINNQIQEWLDAGIIKNSNSEYAAQVLLVSKKNGTKRLCCDYRKINEKIIRDNFPMMLIDDVLAKLQKAKIYTTLDLKNGFFHVPVAKDSQKYTSIVTQHVR